MISKSFQQRQLEELSFNKQQQHLVQLPHQRNLSSTQTADDDHESVNESFQSQDEQNEGLESSATARDVLLLKCRDAIESLHSEIEEERTDKQRLQEELQECQRYINDWQIQDQDKNFKIQKLTEDSISFQSDLHVLSKEKQRLQYDRDELELKVRQLEPLQEETRMLNNERKSLLEQVKKQQTVIEITCNEKQQQELQLTQLRRDNQSLQKEVNELRESLLLEQKKIETNFKTYNEQLQELYVKEQEKKEMEVKREREERRMIEKEYQTKLEELQDKMERCLKEREKEIKDEWEMKVKEIQMKFSQELIKMGEQIQKQLYDIQLIEKDKKQIESDKHGLELKTLEMSEILKSEKLQYEKDIEQIKRELQFQIAQQKEEIVMLSNEVTKMSNENQYLIQEINNYNDLQEKYDDLLAECLTLKQTNEEYKKCLSSKVKEIFQLSKDLEVSKKQYQNEIDLLKQELTAKHNLILKYQEEINTQRENLDHFDLVLLSKDKELKHLLEQQEEEKVQLNKQIREKSNQIQECQEQIKLQESQKLEINKKLSQLEEIYKRDSNLFRSESLKRDEEFEEERIKFDRQLSQLKLHNEQTIDFIQSIKKDLAKMNHNIEKKQEQYEENSSQFVLQTIIDAMKRVIESLNKRIDSFVFYTKSGNKKDSQKTLTTINKENMELFSTLMTMKNNDSTYSHHKY